MFLDDVRNSPKPGHYTDLGAALEARGLRVPEIFHLFAFKPEMTAHLSAFTQEVMRGPSPLSPGLRELIAAFTSTANHCPF